MTTLYPILVTARYEVKILLRSWFFRVFSSLVLIILILLNVALFALPQYSRWMFYGIPSSIPYLNLLLLNLAQAVIGVFMASDFLKNDYKLDSTEVIYIRSMTNASYVIGKILGLLAVFGGLNIIVLFISFIFNIFFVDVSVVTEVYVLYLLLISIPTLMFILGLTFFIMSIIKNQAVTIILLLGYCVSTLFFLNQKFHYLFDYTAFNLPFMYSDFVGFGNITTILTHRGIYFLLGTGFVFTTILLLQRLPQSRLMNRISLILTIGCISSAVVLGITYLAKLSEGKDLRMKMAELNDKIVDSDNITPVSCNLELSHIGSEIAVKADLSVTNETMNFIDRYIFSLNPGLEVTNVTHKGKDISFNRNLHILTVLPENPLQPGKLDSITIFYRGKINEEACYVYVDEETRADNYRLSMYNIDKRYSFITPDYVLLTPENIWYPTAGVLRYDSNSDSQVKHFMRFNLIVKTTENLTAVSQGAATKIRPGEFVFSPETLLPQLSLAIGNYKCHSVSVDSIEYALYFIEGHDYFSEFFEDGEDIISEAISSARLNFEYRLGLSYSYSRLFLIETPIQFFAYPHLLTLSVENVQPEQVFLPEKGILLSNADFRNYTYFTSGQAQRGRGVMTPRNATSNLLRRFIDGTFLGGSSQPFGARALRTRRPQSNLLPIAGLLELGFSGFPDMYSVFPMFYSHVRHFSSERWSIFNTAMEFYLISKIGNQSSRRAAIGGGLTNQDLANFALMEQSLSEMIENPKDIQSIPNVLEQKCAYLFLLFQSEFETETFETFLMDYLSSCLFSDCRVEDFLAELESNFGVDLKPYFDTWLFQKKLPAFIIDEADCYEIYHGEQIRYQVIFNVYNPEPVDGLMEVQFRTSSRGLGGRFGRGGGAGGRMGGAAGGGMSEPEYDEIISIEGSQTKKIGIILDNQPIGMTINTLISQNLPSVLERNFRRIQLNEEAEPFEEEIIINAPISLTEPGAVVVDNEDPGFFVHSFESEGYLKKLLDTSDENEYIQINFRDLPKSWKAVISGNYYGAFRHSAHYIKSGTGGNKVSWKAQLEQNGQYEIYYYVTGLAAMNMRGMRDMGGMTGMVGMGRQGGQAMQRGQTSTGGQARPEGQPRSEGMLDRLRRGGDSESIVQDFNFNIHHDGGVEELKLDVDEAEVGWNLLGTFYITKGETTVELTDLTNGQLVYADAVKWIIRQ